jgi:hypothetical protein
MSWDIGIAQQLLPLCRGLEAVSFAAGAAALAADVASCETGDCDYAALGLDALALIPGGAALRFASKPVESAGELAALNGVTAIDSSLKSDAGFQKLTATLASWAGADVSATSTILGLADGGTSVTNATGNC